MLEQKVAAFDPTSSEYYVDDFDQYKIIFYIPSGKILAAYDDEGKLLRTVERFKDFNIPLAVKTSILKRFPGWTISKNVYVVNYSDEKGSKKTINSFWRMAIKL